jgi:hypothetical protein
MKRAKVKITVKSGKPKDSGSKLLTSVPVVVRPNPNPSGKRMFDSKAKVMLDVRMTKNGNPRIQRRTN